MKKFFIFFCLVLISSACFSQLQIINPGNAFLPYGRSYWLGSSTDSGNRLRMHHSGTDAYIDFFPNLYLRRGTTNAMSINNLGSVYIETQTSDWLSGLRTKVTSPYAVAYNLEYAGRDRFYVSAQGWLWCEKGGYFGSDIKLKKNIKNLDSPLETVLKLKGVEFDYIGDDNTSQNELITGHRIGFVAQDVQEILPGIVKTMPDSSLAIAYTDLTALLVEAIKEQNTELEIVKLKQKSINHDKKENLASIDPVNVNSPVLIPFSLPNDAHGDLIFYDMNGTQLKKLAVSGKDKEIILLKGELVPGMYYYTLILKGKEIDTKRLIITD